MGRLKIAAIALIMAVMSLFSMESMAFYTVMGDATNVITSGDVRMRIVETTATGSEFPKDGVYVIPGDIVSKIVKIENTCEHPMYVRVKLIHSVSNQALSAEDCLGVKIDNVHWTLGEDGFYYYNIALEPAQMTEALFSEVEIVGSKVDNGYIGSVLNLSVQAYGVQSENNGSDPFTAEGWPAVMGGGV